MEDKGISRRDFLSAGLAAGSMSIISQVAQAANAQGAVISQSTQTQAQGGNGRLTFHAIDTHHGATVGVLRVDLSYFEGGKYNLVRRFDTVKNGRSDGPVIQGVELKAGLYEALLHVDDYFGSLKTPLPTPTFLSKVPLRFGINDASQRYHLAVLFNPWSYSYYRGS